jgi:hypothetical protein
MSSVPMGVRIAIFSLNGRPMWKLQADFLPQMAQVAVDSERGLIHMSDYTGKRVLKLLDSAYRGRYGIDGGIGEKIIDLNRQLEKKSR